MLFESLTERLGEAFKKLKNKGKLTESDIKEVMREVRLVLLGADVNIKVVKAFVAAVSERACGAEVLESLKIVNEELITLLGGEQTKVKISSKPPTVIAMVGLQGAGKTTNSAKIASFFKKQGKRPLLVACDVYRPAAIEQLKVVGESVGVPVYFEDSKKPVQIAKNGLEHARKNGNDILIVDTAGRLHIDENLMDELRDIKEAIEPDEILLVVDAMTGQDAVNVATSFNEQLELSGIVMSKMDGDARGGAALSVKYVTGKPIKFVGVGEKLTDIEAFHPDRMASRILGMGDMLTLIEKAQQNFDMEKAAELEKKIRQKKFDLADFLDQMRQMRNMGSMESLMAMMPGVNSAALKDAKFDEKQIDRVEAIICSMTMKERSNPDIINPSRKQRIAKGSGTRVEDVNRLLKQFESTKKMMKQFTDMGKRGGKRGRGMLNLFK